MDNYKLVVPAPRHEAAVLDFLSELRAAGSGFHGGAGIERFEKYSDWLEYRKLFASPDTVPDHWSPDSVWFLTDEDEIRIYGVINLRHMLTDYLLHTGGHIGYEVRPTEQGKGLGEFMLRQALSHCGELGLRRVLLCCDKNNIASASLIKKCGGVLEYEITDSDLADVVQRYWIKPDEKSCGVMISRRIDGIDRFLILFQKKSRTWSFPKGHTEYGETEAQTAVREAAEETGIEVELIPGFRRETTYMLTDGRFKTLTLFLAVTDRDANCQLSEIIDHSWVTVSEALQMLPYKVGYETFIPEAEQYLLAHLADL